MLTLKNVTFSFDNNPTLESIDFTLPAGEHLTIIGASGCGKTTLLEVIYGLHQPDRGLIKWYGKKLKGPGARLIPGEPFFKYVSQHFDLFPFHTVEENVGKHLKSIPEEDKEKRILELLEIVGMEEFADSKGKDLSGGQKQRVALIRALADEPELLLLDEPFSHIDQFRKNDLRRNLFSYLKSKGIACIVATHDSTEVLSFSDRTLIMEKGKIIADGTPYDLYQNPKNKYTASLFGEVNEIFVQDLWNDQTLSGSVLLYPHELTVSANSNFQVSVRQCYFMGKDYLVEAAYKEQKIFFESGMNMTINAKVGLKANETLVRSRM